MDTAEHDGKFAWASFYEAFANALLTWRNRRDELVKGIHLIASGVEGMSHLQDKSIMGEIFPLKDICPFTTMGLFNRNLTDSNRKIIAAKLANLLGVNEPIPDSFAGIPLLNNQKSWFFGYEKSRDPNDIECLWEMFSQAMTFADNQNTNS
ncbi:TPA: AAA family ATPase, partial [Klebsiella pneumoniae]|nr:AAA family ATPase [Klebsiella pneumoniae]